MKRVFYPAGPPKVRAGIAGQFTLGKAKPVSDKTAAMLLARPDFAEAGADIPDDESLDIKALEADAIAADRADAREAKAAEKTAASKKEEVGNV